MDGRAVDEIRHLPLWTEAYTSGWLLLNWRHLLICCVGIDHFCWRKIENKFNIF